MSRLLDPELYAYPASHRVWVRVNMIGSIDGSGQGSDGLSGSLANAADRECFALQRELADAVLVTAGTARAEKYGSIEGRELILASRSLEIPPALRTTGVTVLAPQSCDHERARELQANGVTVLLSGSNQIDWAASFSSLNARGINKLLCEGGPSLVAELSVADLIDEMCLTISPRLVAGSGSRIAEGPEAIDREMSLVHSVDIDSTLLTRWIRSDRIAKTARSDP